MKAPKQMAGSSSKPVKGNDTWTGNNRAMEQLVEKTRTLSIVTPTEAYFKPTQKHGEDFKVLLATAKDMEDDIYWEAKFVRKAIEMFKREAFENNSPF
ncbi:hypothetical protein ColLi_03742 [Colletotrichum liriopes]|uniref:Uncharacterized protein n=1 Tax=Colletotrichum liriopes TaxID=708192 RepID=A0AA37LQ73_9PEZI|nr:hypothetical protein ColLi_03742 [Colletotrichum liriopes]